MFAYLLNVAKAAWNKVVAFCTGVVECVQHVAHRAASVARSMLTGALVIAVSVGASMAVAVAVHRAETQAVKARTLASRLCAGSVTIEDVDATVAAYETHRAYAAAWLAVPDLPTPTYLRRVGKATAVARMLTA